MQEFLVIMASVLVVGAILRDDRED